MWELHGDYIRDLAGRCSELEGEMDGMDQRCTDLEKDINTSVVELGKKASVISRLDSRLKKLEGNTSQRAALKKRKSKKRRSKKRRSKKRRSKKRRSKR